MSANRNKILLSVIVPISQMHGKFRFLKEWVQKLKFDNLEIIFVHDWKDEETEIELIGIIEEVKTNKPKLVTGKFGSPGHARNAGLKVASGDWIAFWDSDDQPIVTNFIEMIEKADVSNYDFALGEFITFDQQKGETSVPNISSENGSELNYLEVLKNPGLWRWSFRRAVIENIEFCPFNMGEDQIFLLSINAFNSKKFMYGENVYIYTINQRTQLTNQKNMIADLVPAINFLDQFLESRQMKEAMYISIKFYFTVLKKGLIRTKFLIMFKIIKILFRGRFERKVKFFKGIYFYISKQEWKMLRE